MFVHTIVRLRTKGLWGSTYGETKTEIRGAEVLQRQKSFGGLRIGITKGYFGPAYQGDVREIFVRRLGVLVFANI